FRLLPRLQRCGEPFTCVFLDPPYASGLLLPAARTLSEAALLAAGAVVVAEHDRRQEVPDKVGNLKAIDRRRYGDTCLTLFVAEGA
ncbi:MAG: RsmD family RNA methyltransferase, partial [Clostridia bacterium]|nr:RsmD family RNA methyltransferase [Clostridia bacterium]